MDMIKIILPGIYSSIQDNGRRGYRKFGMPLSGAMDPYAFRRGNLILGNKPGSAAVEITGHGFECEFQGDAKICVTGADLGVELKRGNKKINLGKIISVKKGERLNFTRTVCGLRAYMHIAGGIDSAVRMGSRSMQRSEKLNAGDKLGVLENSTGLSRGYYSNSYIEESGDYILRVRKGPDANLFPDKYLKQLKKAVFTVSSYHDRMGIRLDHSIKIEPVVKSIVTKPVFPGCIQMPGNGSPIIIMNDGQTTGGYPIWVVIEKEDLRIAGQLKSGDNIKFLHV